MLEKILYKIRYYYLNLLAKIEYKIDNFFLVDGINENKDIYNIIVSLTTIPSRYKDVQISINTIMRQTLKPKKIILYIDKKNEHVALPNGLKKLVKRGLTIEYVNDEIKAHTKYYYALKKNTNSVVITVDDDIIYDKNLIKRLYDKHKKYPKSVICARAHKITFLNNELAKYSNWEGECDKIRMPSNYLFATGVGGVLYPTGIFKDTTFDLDLIKKLSLNNDDIWLKYMEILSGVKVCLIDGKIPRLVSVRGSQKVGLYKTNVGKNINDVIIKKLTEYFKITREDFED